MNTNIKRRLEHLEGRFGSDQQRVLVIQQPGESREGMDYRLERWKAGEEVEGVRAEPYQSGKVWAVYVRFTNR